MVNTGDDRTDVDTISTFSLPLLSFDAAIAVDACMAFAALDADADAAADVVDVPDDTDDESPDASASTASTAVAADDEDDAAVSSVLFADLGRLRDDAARPPSVLREARVSEVGSSTPVPLC